MKERILEGRWDCKYCDTVGIRGSVYECPNCGKTRGADTKFYLPKDAEEAQDKNVEADWYCPYCKSLNHAADKICENCGYTRAEEDTTYFSQRESEERKSEEHKKSFYSEHEQSKTKKTKEKKTGIRKVLHILRNIALVSLVLLIVGIIYFYPRDYDGEVIDTSWRYIVDIENYRNVEENDWELPDEAEIIEEKSEIHHYDKVFSHYETKTRQVPHRVLSHYETYYTTEDLGNGNFREVEHSNPVYETKYTEETYQEAVYDSVPQYQTKYYYKIWKWVFDREELTSGSYGDSPEFYDLEESEYYRITDSRDYYFIQVKLKDETIEMEVDKELWSRFKPGDIVVLTKMGSDWEEIKHKE